MADNEESFVRDPSFMYDDASVTVMRQTDCPMNQELSLIVLSGSRDDRLTSATKDPTECPEVRI
jgi:hypothetical protein